VPAVARTWLKGERHERSVLVAEGHTPRRARWPSSAAQAASVVPPKLPDEIIGWNATGCPNLRLTIRLIELAPR
jgi:hypothetical protein